MSDVLVNNFTTGEVSPKLAGRPDLGVYHTGVSVLKDCLVMLQGGATRRPGTVSLGTVSGSRVIPFIISADLAFLIELGTAGLRIHEADGTVVMVNYSGSPTEWFPVDYLTSEIDDLQFTQSFDTLFIAHRNHAPKKLKYTGGSFTWGTLVPTTDAKYSGMFQGAGNYPGCVAYCSNRLWFASSLNHPYRLWASRPFELEDFRTYDIVQTITQVIKDAPWPEGWEADQSLIYEDQIDTNEVTSADNAMVLEVGSNRNDRIEWITVGQNLVVGTASGEWIMPGNIDALNQAIMQVSAYGSAPLQALNVNEDILFIQSGRKRCRGYVYAQGGYSSPDMTYTADHILASGVKDWAFQRVPEPRAYMVLGSGDLAVLSYNKMYQIQGWARWTFSGDAKSVAVLDTPYGQDVYIVVERDGTKYLEMFDFDSAVFSDHHNADPIEYLSYLESNPFETQLQSGSSIGKQKRVTEVIMRVMDTEGIRVGYDKLETHEEVITEGDVRVRIGGGYEKRLKMKVESIGDKPMTILAMVYRMEVA